MWRSSINPMDMCCSPRSRCARRQTTPSAPRRMGDRKRSRSWSSGSSRECKATGDEAEYYENVELPDVRPGGQPPRARRRTALSAVRDPLDKILDWAGARMWRQEIRGRVVFTNGVFDL